MSQQSATNRVGHRLRVQLAIVASLAETLGLVRLGQVAADALTEFSVFNGVARLAQTLSIGSTFVAALAINLLSFIAIVARTTQSVGVVLLLLIAATAHNHATFGSIVAGTAETLGVMRPRLMAGLTVARSSVLVASDAKATSGNVFLHAAALALAGLWSMLFVALAAVTTRKVHGILFTHFALDFTVAPLGPNLAHVGQVSCRRERNGCGVRQGCWSRHSYYQRLWQLNLRWGRVVGGRIIL